MDINSKVSPSLHPLTITTLDSYAQHADCVSFVADAMLGAYEAIHGIHDARDKLNLDVTRTKEARVLHAADLSDKHLGVIQKKFESSWDRLNKGILSIESSLTEPVQKFAGIGNVATEIRSHFKGMSSKDRRNALEAAMDSSDERTLQSLLGAPSYLSGFTELEHSHNNRLYHEKMNPELASRLDLMKQVRGKLEAAKPIILTEMSKAIGVSANEVNKLRAANKAANEALKAS